MKFMLVMASLTALAALPGSAMAGCQLVAGPCSTDSYGNTYITRQSLSGTGYVTTRNGNPYSHTGETLGGGWREDFTGGGYQMHSTPPYQPTTRPKSSLGW